MFQIDRVKNYKQFADVLRAKTGCKNIEIKVMDRNGEHVHYQIKDKDGLPLGVLCIDKGYASFAPFVTFDNVCDEQYVSVTYMTQVEEFTNLLKVFKEMFVVDYDAT